MWRPGSATGASDVLLLLLTLACHTLAPFFSSRMPVERTPKKSLHQTTLSGFTKSSTASKPPRATSPDSLSDEPSPPKRVQSAPKSTKPKKKPKAKAGDENRVATDAILSIKPEFTKLIAARKKNHEYRKYKLETVTRFWLYETAPTSAITYVSQSCLSHVAPFLIFDSLTDTPSTFLADTSCSRPRPRSRAR